MKFKDMRSGFTEKIKGLRINRKMLITGAVAAVIFVIACISLAGNDGEVDFRIIRKNEIPQEITSDVIPQYRTLERALACVSGDRIYVIVTRGEKPTSGYSLAIDGMKIEEDKGKENLIVHAAFKDPEPGESISQVVTYPLEIAETELEELPDSIELRVKY